MTSSLLITWIFWTVDTQSLGSESPGMITGVCMNLPPYSELDDTFLNDLVGVCQVERADVSWAPM